MAREAHDTLLQALSGVTVQMQALWARLPASPEKQRLAAIIADAGKCCAEARRSSHCTGKKRTA
jgi:signal transduction histidine kinase